MIMAFTILRSFYRSQRGKIIFTTMQVVLFKNLKVNTKIIKAHQSQSCFFKSLEQEIKNKDNIRN